MSPYAYAERKQNTPALSQLNHNSTSAAMPADSWQFDSAKGSGRRGRRRRQIARPSSVLLPPRPRPLLLPLPLPFSSPYLPPPPFSLGFYNFSLEKRFEIRTTRCLHVTSTSMTRDAVRRHNSNDGSRRCIAIESSISVSSHRRRRDVKLSVVRISFLSPYSSEPAKHFYLRLPQEEEAELHPAYLQGTSATEACTHRRPQRTWHIIKNTTGATWRAPIFLSTNLESRNKPGVGLVFSGVLLL